MSAERRVCKTVYVGGLALGGENPVRVQSMLNVPAQDVAGNVRSAQELEKAGCDILRVSVPKMEDVRLIEALKEAVKMPIVADIHFDYRIALACVEAGVDKVRLNPGNIGDDERVAQVAKACKQKGVPIRIGVNGGSLKKELLAKYGHPTAEALCESALAEMALLERFDFNNIVISLKSSHVPTNVKAYRLLAQQCAYPLHLGVTEAGLEREGLIKNAMGIGSLLLDGIGDTLRVSLTASPVREVEAGFEILRAAGQPVAGPEIISCPTCGRTCIAVEDIATQVKERLKGSKNQVKVAVMGCVVNGLGEGKEADVGLAGGKNSAVIFKKGERVRTVRENFVEELLKEVQTLDD